MPSIAKLVTQVQNHWQRELSKAVKVIAETGRERDALQAELTATQAVLNAAMAGRRWQIDRALKTEAENARLTVQLRIATGALEAVREMRGLWPIAKANGIAREALTRLSALE